MSSYVAQHVTFHSGQYNHVSFPHAQGNSSGTEIEKTGNFEINHRYQRLRQRAGVFGEAQAKRGVWPTCGAQSNQGTN